MATQKTTDKEAMAAWRAIEKVLPSVLRRGALAELEASAPEGSGLSWSNLPKAELMAADSELANFEKLRRVVGAIEGHNLRSGLDGSYAPTPALLSKLSGVGEDIASQWLARASVRSEIAAYLKRLRLDGADHQKLANFNRLQSNGQPKVNPVEVIDW